MKTGRPRKSPDAPAARGRPRSHKADRTLGADERAAAKAKSERPKGAGRERSLMSLLLRDASLKPAHKTAIRQAAADGISLSDVAAWVTYLFARIQIGLEDESLNLESATVALGKLSTHVAAAAQLAVEHKPGFTGVVRVEFSSSDPAVPTTDHALPPGPVGDVVDVEG